MTLPEDVKAISLQQNVLELKRSVRIRVLIQEIRFVLMDLKEIEQCLQKYAKELNEKGGRIYLIAYDSEYYIFKQSRDYYGYPEVTVDGADLVLNGWGSDQGKTNRIPYHAISRIIIG